MKNIGNWDYIIAGAGSAGCVLASRLSEDPNCKVLLIDAGGDPNSFWIKTPAGMANMFYSDQFNWKYYTEPVKNLNNRKIYWPRGKTLGGSSAINGMVYTRGHRKDYDQWASEGNSGWSWLEIKPFFEKAENQQLNKKSGSLFLSEPVIEHTAVKDFINLSENFGIKKVENLSSSGEEGAGVLKATIKNGQRASTFNSYIEPYLNRKNLSILKNSHINKIIFDGKKAVGLSLIRNGEAIQATSNAEVILSAGVIGSAQILFRSGIADRGELTKAGVSCLQHLPGVGKNLQDHCSIQIKALTHSANSYNQNLLGLRKYLEGFKYLLGMKSYLSLASSQAAAFIKSNSSIDYADLEISFRPMTFSFNSQGLPEVDPFAAVGAAVYRVRPDSRGYMEFDSPDPYALPKIYPKYLEDERDLKAMVNGVRWVYKLFLQQPKVYQTHELASFISDEERIAEFIRNNAKCAYHPVGTCKMGNDSQSVVDANLKVIGIERLRVVDASIMPTIVSGNTNAATVLIAEKGASMIMCAK